MVSAPRLSQYRYVVVGAGAVGAALGGALHAAGAEVVLCARGAHAEVLRRDGLTLRLPSRTRCLPVRVIAHPRELAFAARDVIVCATKLSDAEPALTDLAAAAPRDTPLVAAQNGVAGERLARARFDRVYGMLVFMPAELREPGVVSVYAGPALGGLDIGCDPEGTDALAEEIVSDLVAAGFDARAEPRILRQKLGKLLTNLGNAVQALAGDAALASPVLGALRDEALACYRAAGLDFASAEEIGARFAAIDEVPVEGARRGGGSSWQSLARATGRIETGFLNGEIVRLGDAHGVPTPVNRAITALAQRAAEERWAPAALSVAALEAALRDPSHVKDRALEDR